MASKVSFYATMAEDAAKQITASREQWTAFLNTSARFYKYPYYEQLMIYSQRPNATACAEYDLWMNKMNRYVKKGAKGIALIDNSGDHAKIRYVFDVADTGVRKTSRSVNIWRFSESVREPVQEALEKAFGVSAQDTGFENQIEQIARHLAGEYWTEHGKQILDIVAESYLAEYDEYNIGASFRNAATTSIAYAIFTRCIDNPDSYFEHEDFLDIFDFNTRQTANALGTAVSSISTQIFREIEVTIKRTERMKQAERSQDNDERNDIQPERRLSDSRYSVAAERTETLGQVRTDAEIILGGEQSDTLQRSGANGEVVSAPAGNRRNSEPAHGTADEGISDQESSTEQNGRSDGLGAAHDEPAGTSGGNRTDGAYQQLSMFLSEQEQIRFIDEAESKMLPAFSFEQSEVDLVLQNAINSDYGRMIVVLDYMKQKPLEQIIETLQNVYHGGYGLKEDSHNLSVWFGENGISLAAGNSAEYMKNAQVITWQDAAVRIGELLEAGQYATNIELDEAPGYMRELLAQACWYLYMDISEEGRNLHLLPSMEEIRGGGFPEETQRLAEMLKDESFIEKFKAEFADFISAHNDNHSLLRFHYHKLERMEQLLFELDMPLKEFHTEMKQMPLVRQFITSDEIDHALGSGSGIEGGKYRIHEYWKENHSKSEKIAFLKNEYGVGGHSHALSGSTGSGEDHDAKGIRYTKEGCDIVQLSWAQVVAHIDQLVRTGRYITEKEQQEYEAKQLFSAYNETKEHHPDDIVLYQVNEFFEMYGEDAKLAAQELNINLTTRRISGVGTVPMCGIPTNQLENSLEILRDKHDVTLSAIPSGQTERQVLSMKSIDHEAEQAIDLHEAEFGADGLRAFNGQDTMHLIHADDEAPVIGKIDYLGTNGYPGESIEYTDPELFQKDIQSDTEYGVPLTITVYRDAAGKTIPYDFIYELDPPPKGFNIEDAPMRTVQRQENFADKVIADVEHISSADTTPPYERFSVTPVEDGGFVIWDDLNDRVYVDANGIGEQFVTEAEATDYLETIKKEADVKMASEWEYVERSKSSAQPSLIWDEMFQEVEIFEQPALFSNRRLRDEEIPEGLYRYDLRGSDNDPGDPISVEKTVVVNHAASIITMEPLTLGERGELLFTDDEGLNFVGGNVTLLEFWQDQSRQKAIMALTDDQQLTVRAWETAGFRYNPGEHRSEIEFLDATGYPSTYKSWEEARQAIESAELKDYPGLKEQVQELLHSQLPAQWNYQIGDTVFLEDDSYQITDITDTHVELLPYGQNYPIYRSENRENFERLLAADTRNFDFRNFAVITADEMNIDVLTVFTESNDFFSQQERQNIVNMIDGGATNHKIAENLKDLFTGRSGIMDNSYGTELKFDAHEDRLAVELHDIGGAFYELTWEEVAAVLRSVKNEFLHAMDVPAERIRTDDEYFIDHFYVVEDLKVQGPLAIKEYSLFDDALRAYQKLPTDKIKALGAAKVSDPLPGSLDLMQCIDGQDKVVQDYTKVQGWENPEIITVVEKLTAAIETQRIPDYPAVNFQITDDHLGEGGAKAKFQANIEAIKLLHTLQEENRNANPDEQEVLSHYVGWGGLADAFDSNKSAWANEYQTLKENLTQEEYEAARASTLNAHYTSPTIINAIYDAVENFGFETGNILEPACGTGNFLGLLPEKLRNSNLHGVELDTISGHIAQKLYPKAEITVAGFETTDRRDFYDLAVGNVPFGNYKVLDKPYDKLGFSIHNYFFAKSLDQVRPGGIVAFVTSRYTMDAKKSDARRYIAQRADLLGAIRLPNDAFKQNAGAEVVSDIIFLQKRDCPIEIEPEWVQLDTTPDGYTLNSYFVEHPEMILGELSLESTPYGKDDLTVRPRTDTTLAAQLQEAISHIGGTYHSAELSVDDDASKPSNIVPADPRVKNFSYAVIDNEVYFRENSIMRTMELNDKAKERIIGMVNLREIVTDLISYQLEDYPEDQITGKQHELKAAYDSFTKDNGLLNNRANAKVFSQDSSYFLLCSLEDVDEDGKLKGLADMFTKRTIKPERKITSVDTPSEALAISIGEHGKVDLPYMAELLGTPNEFTSIISDLRGVIYKDPMVSDDLSGWQTADEYLSGDVRSKLQIAKLAAKDNPDFTVNVQALEKAQPKDLDASEIDVRLGATWIAPDYIQQFMTETFQTPFYLQHSIQVKFSELTAEWRISEKNATGYNDVTAYATYGTDRANAYRILEDSLNLKDVRVYDMVEDADGKQKRILNKKETTLAQQKQQAIKDAFKDWVWKDPERREKLVEKYNVLFNSTKPREYDGTHIVFSGMNPDIKLREHQRNAVAHVLYGGNTLLAHEVGAGKTFEMVASAMESKRLGLCQKSLIVVPNHLTTQWANEFLQLYPSAKILVATKKDFETANRKKFCGRIATGDYDAVIIGHSQFEKIPLSAERQEQQLNTQIEEIEEAIADLKWQRGENFTIKQMEKTRKSLQVRLEKLMSTERKDDVVTFEQLGVDRLFVDESHAFKNLFLYTKMRNVAGLSTSEAQKSSDMFMKCRYMDELTGGRGVVFATGTPVSNSMTELYTVMRYLQYSTLEQKKLTHFDSWASTFGETSTAIELAPEGTGYRARTRFAKFFNLPELMNMFKEVADIKTSDQLELPVPDAKFETVVVQPSEYQQEMVAELSERAALVHSGSVDPSVDNMLKITSDGRKLGLDQRLINPMLPDDPNSKLNACVNNVIRIWEDGKADKLTQLLFCDLSTPKKDGTFNVYDDIKSKLLLHGIPEKEIAFIHDADSESKKKELFGKVRNGQVRVLLGSTQKMGAGTNVQDLLVAVHHLDVGWRPADMTQRNGRIIRQGNRNKEVQVYQYVTEGTFDAYLYQTLENKQKFISQIMTSKSPVRSCDDVDEQALSYAEIKALCAGNPLIKEKMDLDIEVARLKVLKSDHQSQQYRMEDKLLKYFPAEMEQQKGYIKGFEADQALAQAHPQAAEGFCGMKVMDKFYAEKVDAGEILLAACKQIKCTDPVVIGEYRNFQMQLSFDSFRHEFDVLLKGTMAHRVSLGTDARGNITRLDNALAAIPDKLQAAKDRLDNLEKQREAAQAELGKPFPQEQELKEKSARLAELDAALNMEESSQSAEEISEDERPSVLADLKSKSAEIPPCKRTENREEVL